MDAVAAQPRRELQDGGHRPRRWLWLGVGTTLLILAAVVLLVLRPPFLVRLLEPRFWVLEVQPVEHTVRVQRANHLYLLQCGSDCDQLQVGQSYEMEVLSDHIRCRVGQRDLTLPIIEEEVGFTRTGGHG
jgi:hypothetical protein